MSTLNNPIPDTKAVKDARGVLDAKRNDLHDVFTQAGDDLDHSKVKGHSFASGSDLRDYVSSASTEINGLQDDLQGLLDVERIKRGNADEIEKAGILTGSVVHKSADAGEKKDDSMSTLTAMKRVREEFMEKAYSGGQFLGEAKGRTFGVDIDPMDLVKTDFTTAAGWAPEDTRIGRTIFDAQRPAPHVVDVIPSFPTAQSTVLFMEETTFTNNAAEAAENAAIAEAALVFTEQSSEVRKIGVSLPATDEVLEDVAQMRSIIDQRLRFMIAQRLDLQVLVGNGTAPNISGVHDRTGIGAQAKGTDSDPDAIHKAITVCRVTGFADPDTVIIHPNDWESIRLLQTADGIYVFGSPSDAGPARIWGLPVVQSTAETATQALVGDFRTFSALFNRRGVNVEVSNAHASEFLDGIQRVRMDMRAAFVVYRPAAFTEVTGL